ncbi:hypothetical protein EG028_14590 [Chitinophaga barathri]|uniref:Uncharacterized protein n=1 Tax=Chitinophaga barathri TaxID=1647451 RepID=A0A3N4MKB6_9BACT|nr:hypothetical protein EG028_14590 [Chitinophaga barathri]
MIDGIKSVHPYLTAGTWEASPLLGFVVAVDQQTGELAGNGSYAAFNGLRFEVRPSSLQPGAATHCLKGSLHKYHNGGAHNANSFPFAELVKTVQGLEASFSVLPDRATLHGLEIGVNIWLPFSPLRVLKQVICYINKPFTQIDRRNRRLGLVCSLCEYDVKLYDKGAQSGVKTGHLLRLEVKVKKMRFIRGYGIATMADLTEASKVFPLFRLLSEVLRGIVFMDLTLSKQPLNAHEHRQFLVLSNPKGWEEMSKYQLSRNRERAELLMHRHSKRQIKPLLFSLLAETWAGLFGMGTEAITLQPFHRLDGSGKGGQPATFSHLEYKGKKVAATTGEYPQEKTGIYSAKDAQKNSAKTAQRSCKTCRRDISTQHPRSRFCSERLYGSAGKACRNKDSNHRRDLKRIINTAMNTQQFIAITYSVGGDSYTDTLHPSELEVTRNWLDKITRIDLLPTGKGDRLETLTGNKAQAFIQQHINNTSK